MSIYSKYSLLIITKNQDILQNRISLIKLLYLFKIIDYFKLLSQLIISGQLDFYLH